MKLSEALRTSMERFDPLGGRFHKTGRPGDKPQACVWGGIARVVDSRIDDDIDDDTFAKKTVDVLCMMPEVGYDKDAEKDHARLDKIGGFFPLMEQMDAAYQGSGKDLAELKVGDFPMLDGFSLYNRYRFFNDFLMERKASFGADPRPAILADMLERGL